MRGKRLNDGMIVCSILRTETGHLSRQNGTAHAEIDAAILRKGEHWFIESEMWPKGSWSAYRTIMNESRMNLCETNERADKRLPLGR